jgi:HemY protein
MLWSLVKILAFVAVVVALTFGGAWLMDLSGGAVIAIAGYEVTLSPLEMTIGFLVLAFLLWVAQKVFGFLLAVIHFINGDETAISRYFTRNRERKGYEALTEGMMALASGEGSLALAKATQADKYLDRPDLTNVMIAQAAELAGDRKKAEATYKLLLQDERTRFVGVRGLMKQKLEDGDTVTALRLAEKAFQMKPKHVETQDVLLRLQAESHDWAGARATLGAKLKTGTLPRDVHRRRDAVLALSQAADLIADESSIEKREATIEANKLSPDLIPAAAMAARSYIAQGNAKYATRVLTKAWSVQPHPDLAAAFAEIVPDETSRARLKRFEALTKLRPEHPETKMLLAELLIAAEDFPAARRALGDLPSTEPTARNLTLMAAITRGEGGDDAMVRGWLTKALTASRGPQWVCDNCGTVHANWGPVCSSCHGFDTLSWKTPPAAEFTLPGGVEMLPLLVGKPGEKADGATVENVPAKVD